LHLREQWKTGAMRKYQNLSCSYRPIITKSKLRLTE
jgi:hypothetical protein